MSEAVKKEGYIPTSQLVADNEGMTQERCLGIMNNLFRAVVGDADYESKGHQFWSADGKSTICNKKDDCLHCRMCEVLCRVLAQQRMLNTAIGALSHSLEAMKNKDEEKQAKILSDFEENKVQEIMTIQHPEIFRAYSIMDEQQGLIFYGMNNCEFLNDNLETIRVPVPESLTISLEGKSDEQKEKIFAERNLYTQKILKENKAFYGFKHPEEDVILLYKSIGDGDLVEKQAETA